MKWLLNLFKKTKSHSNEKKPTQFDVSNFLSSNEIDPILFIELPNGLLPGEVVLLDWMDGKNMNINPPGYFEYTYGLDVKDSIEKLVDKEFLDSASPIESLESLKVTELKDILKKNNLKVSGKKSELVTRLKENSEKIDIKSYINDRFFKITDKGKEVFSEFYYIVPAHKNNSKDGVYCVATAIDFVSDNNLQFKPNNGDISWALFQKYYLKNHSQKMYGLARNNLYAMAKQLQREGKLNYSLKQHLNVIIMDLSGLSNNANLDGPGSTRLSPGIINQVKNIIKTEQINENQLFDAFEEAWSEVRQSIPFHYLDKTECYECLMKALEGNYEYVNRAIDNSFEKIDKETFESVYQLRLPVSYT